MKNNINIKTLNTNVKYLRDNDLLNNLFKNNYAFGQKGEDYLVNLIFDNKLD